MTGTREQLAAVARSWLRTPYVHAANVKGHGVDCGMLLCETFREPLGPLPADFDPRPYARHHYLHRDEEHYLAWIMKYAHQVEAPPQLADILIYKVGRCVSHGAIYVGDGLCVHAYSETRRVELASVTELAGMRGFHYHSTWSVF